MGGVNLAGQVALVTGASAGLGQRFAQTLAEAGAAVVVTARRADRLDALVDKINAAGGRAMAQALDLRDAAAIAATFDAAEKTFGMVDILVNNAGISDGNYAARLSLEEIDNVIDTNFRTPFLMATEMARRLIAAKRPGRIVNLSSIGAYSYGPTSAAALYASTKAGISRLTETLALEWARFGINVNAIAPGMFMSEMTEGYLSRVGDGVKQQWPRGRFGQPEFLDSTLLYLVDPASHFVTGTIIVADDAQSSR